MELKEIMQFQNFAILGNTINPEGYAYKIKQGLLEHGYTVFAVGKELKSLNDIDDDIDVIDLCINAEKGLKLLEECKKPYKCIVIQPGASSEKLVEFLQKNNIDFIDGCLLVGMSLYAKKNN